MITQIFAWLRFVIALPFAVIGTLLLIAAVLIGGRRMSSVLVASAIEGFTEEIQRQTEEARRPRYF